VTQDLLIAKKLKAAKAVIQKIVSVDLDGDRVNEILIEAAPQARLRGMLKSNGPA